MNELDENRYYLEELADVRAKRDDLPSDSPMRQALTDDVLHAVEQKISEASASDLGYGYWPFLYGFVARKSRDAIIALDADIRLVVQNTTDHKRLGITQFLKTPTDKRQGEWCGGLFEVWMKATAIASGCPFELDSALPNGRDHDVCLRVNRRRFHLECTVLSQDDESADVWKRYLEAKRLEPSKVLVRPGPFCPPSAKGPSPYYTTLRFYAKVFDKLTKDLNPLQSQFADDEPNVLLVSFSGPSLSGDDPAVGWGLDELFAAQPRMARSVVPESFTDISVDAWVDFRAMELIRSGRITVEWFCDHSNEVMQSPRRLGAILLLDGCTLVRSRINYNAECACAISHRNMAELERFFTREVPYWMK